MQGTIRTADSGNGVVFETPNGVEALRCSGLPETFSFAAATTGLVAVLQGEGRYDEALRMSDWLRERFPTNPVALYHRARILEALGRPADALRAWDDLVDRLSDSARVSHGFLAECHLHRARIESARGATAPAADALRLASFHAVRRDPQLEMEGPFEDFDAIRS